MAMRIRKTAEYVILRTRGMAEVWNLHPVCVSDICHE